MSRPEDAKSPLSDSDRLKDLDRRLREREDARRARAARGSRHAAAAGLGVAWRLSLELVVAFAAGGFLGYGLDALLKTTPWFLMGGLIFGFAAGVRNAFRAAREMEAAGGASPKAGADGTDDA